MKSKRDKKSKQPPAEPGLEPVSEKQSDKTSGNQSVMEKFPKPNTFPRNWDLSSFLKE